MVQVKKIPGFPNYSVTSDGEIISHRSTGDIVMKPSTSTGYPKVGLSIDGQTFTRTVHRLVAEAFCHKPKGMDVVNHIDGNKLNSAAANLEWVNLKKNAQHAVDVVKRNNKINKLQAAHDRLSISLGVLVKIKESCGDDFELFNDLASVVLARHG